MRKTTRGFLILFAMMFLFGVAVHLYYYFAEDRYPLLVKVVENIDGILTLEDRNGNWWEWEEDDEWNVGDYAVCVVNDRATPDDLRDDVIEKLDYTGVDF